MKILVGVLVVLLMGCAAPTAELLEKRDRDNDDRQDRAVEFAQYSSWCWGQGGYPIIDRKGKATRRDEILGIPGRGDKVHCRGVSHRIGIG